MVRAMAVFCFMPVDSLSVRTSAKLFMSNSVESTRHALDAGAALHFIQSSEEIENFAGREARVESHVAGKKPDLRAHFFRFVIDVEAVERRGAGSWLEQCSRAVASVVVLPAPLGPSRPKTSPLTNFETNAIDGQAGAALRIGEGFR